jgi:hypothetical protein
MNNDKMSVLGYDTLFTCTGIHLGNTGLKVSHIMYLKGFIMLDYYLTPDLAVWRGNVTPTSGSIQIGLRFAEALVDPVT